MTIWYPYEIDGTEYNSEVIVFDLDQETSILLDNLCKETGERREVAMKRILMESIGRR